MQGLSIGAVAKKAGVNVETLRYYERRGLLPLPPRSESGYRHYPEEAVRRVRFIKRAQDLGFSLKEVEELLSLRSRPEAPCSDMRMRAEAKIADIDEKLEALQRIRRALCRLVEECPGDGPITACPILDSLEPQT